MLRVRVALVPYDPRWPLIFAEEREHLLSGLARDMVRRVEHFATGRSLTPDEEIGCRVRVLSLLLGCLCAFGWTFPPSTAAAADRNDAHVQFAAIVDGVWTHTSQRDLPGVGPFPANGLVLRAADGSVLVDTAWTPEQTAVLLDWTEGNVGPVQAVIVTHWHDDRSGGLAEVHRRGIPSYGSQRTIREADLHGTIPPRHALDDTSSLSAFGVEGEVYFPGAGHTVDNVVVWVSTGAVLFGGCLIRPQSATTLGNTADADVDTWPIAVRRVRDRYRNAAWVVPGHGAAGGAELLAHTISLAEAGDARTRVRTPAR